MFLLVLSLLAGNAVVVAGWGSSDKVKLTDVSVITLRHGMMTNSRRTHPVPQLKCVGGSAGCSSFVPQVVQCYNRGSDGYHVQWECKTDMDSGYRFGDIAVNCEGYDYPDDPYVLKGSCGLEYTIDYVGRGHQHHSNAYSYRDNSHQHYSGHHRSHHRGSWFGTIIMWGLIAMIAYYIYTHWTNNQFPGGHTQTASPPPAGFRPEYMPGSYSTTSSQTGSSGGAGFWSGAATGGLLGYLFGSSGRQRPYYDGYGYHGPTPHHRGYGYGFGGGTSGWFGSNNSWSSGWSSGSTYRRSPDPPSSRTASGFGGTKRR